MSLSKQIIIDQISTDENGNVFFREATRLLENGEVISTSYHRTSLEPNQDLTGLPSNVVAVCNAVWTPEILAAHQKKKDDAAEAQRLAEEKAAQEKAEADALAEKQREEQATLNEQLAVKNAADEIVRKAAEEARIQKLAEELAAKMIAEQVAK